MRRSIPVLTTAVLIALSAVSETAAPEPQQYWPQWRGPLGTGEAPHAKPLISWGASQNVKWKVEIPGIGKSTPIVWKDLVVLTTAVPAGSSQEFVSKAGLQSSEGQVHFAVMALNRKDGAVRWRRV